MKLVLLPFPDQQLLAASMATSLKASMGRLDWRHFPDGESLVTIEEKLAGYEAAIIATLRNPDSISLAMRFAAATAREFGARSVGLVAPYLAYMRQDKRFNPGEAISAPLFAQFLEQSFDWLVTADPHLHRNPNLSDLYRIPVRRVVAAPAVAGWIETNVRDAILIGPDRESEQWVSDIAKRARVPYQVLNKTRRGDRNVTVSIPTLDVFRQRTPVIIDDIVSSGHTLIETVRNIKQLGFGRIICIVIHPVFADGALEQIVGAGAIQVVSSDSITHPTNGFSIAGLLASAVDEVLTSARAGKVT